MSDLFRVDQPLCDEVRRLAKSILTQSINELSDRSLDQHETVHESRKRFKKLRALLRMVREPLGDEVYRRENESYRDSSRLLSPARDSEAMIEGVELLADTFEDDAFQKITQKAKAGLEKRQEQLVKDLDLDAVVEEVVGRLHQDLVRVDDWALKSKGTKLLKAGVQKIYRDGVKLLATCEKEPDTHLLHEWRKAVKYHWHQVKFMAGAWPTVLDIRASEQKSLSDHLGDDHDLALLSEIFAESPREFGLFRLTNRKIMADAIGTLRTRLQSQALCLGRRLYAESPKEIWKRLDEYWQAWQDDPADHDTVTRPHVSADLAARGLGSKSDAVAEPIATAPN